MPWTESFPFRRVRVNHAIEGVTTIWWELVGLFNDSGPRLYQLQAGFTGVPGAIDWIDVGDPVEDAWYLQDTEKRLHGKRLLTHYRVKVTTPRATYVSNPAGCYGDMPEEDWILCREIVRKEVLRMGKVARSGFIFKRFRNGIPCPRCLDPLTKEVQDAKCPQCGGTRFKVGYHPPMPMACFDMGGETIDEQRETVTTPGQSRNDGIKVRVLGSPDMSKDDVWADFNSGQRWIVDSVVQVAVWRGVPLVLELTMLLLEYTNYAYRLTIGNDPDDAPLADPPTTGNGCVRVTHDYGGEDNLAYRHGDCGVSGATIRAFTRSDYDGAARDPSNAVATVTTDADGRWAVAMLLDPGEYMLVAEKVGEFRPTAVPLTVVGPDASSSSSASAPSASLASRRRLNSY